MSRTLSELDKAVAVQEVQMGRFVSDIESEKATRARSNTAILARLDNFDERQRQIQMFQNKMIGGLIVLQFATMVFLALKK